MPGTEVRTWRLASGSAEPSPSALWFPNGASAHPKMAWRQLLLVCCLSAAVLLTTLQEGAGASVGTQQEAGQDVREDVEQKIFMQESDASNFLKRRSKRSPKSQDEVNVAFWYLEHTGAQGGSKGRWCHDSGEQAEATGQ
ncbi:putative cartilage matrix-associated protein isoform X2 [Herpailurus yagouaroundi]|uniref:putative cartilage matrix-associated protein isoform X2 n=1 Tax=Herpailurus yagouaroundi TaxID=1608482 RepID=UPI001AD75D92|nr:unique cartilage matrix-associated protein isoform X2 [Puma yagouaroundi]